MPSWQSWMMAKGSSPASAGAALEHVPQRRDAQLGLDDGPLGVVEERLAVVDERLPVSLQKPPDGDHARPLRDGEVGRGARSRDDDARLQEPHGHALVVEEIVELAEIERRGCEAHGLDERAAPAGGAHGPLVEKYIDRSADGHRADVAGGAQLCFRGELIAGLVDPGGDQLPTEAELRAAYDVSPM